ncbi:allophanate hydrolase subunit 1 [Streptomyces sp. PTM05]|uniref:Allophanate hydrolase subunit 1 n=1 Tax=Streptantibioticus parmotrematis TaxID=2873249 RepID=A0ABS7QSJ8_9ACTN|nr:allophanate hydrolase subunit 1 [Streptantibioticus parmotrematis]MBY8885664.1 allophanate hydrolase subunit 1 [Streptantibioticus parmotrematis]
MRMLPVGDSGLLVELPDGAAVEALYAELLRRTGRLAAPASDGHDEGFDTLPAVGEIVPAARTILLTGLAQPSRFAAELATWRIPPRGPSAGRVVELPIRYDGPDLAAVAALWGVSEREVAREHAATEFRVAFCGFAPGFGYLTGLPEHRHVPRRDVPRTSVPRGSVGLAGPYTGVYPRSSPGGWQVVGTTDAALWDPAREPAALLTPGTRVRFVPEGGE